MSSLDDELAEIESQTAYGVSAADYAQVTSNKRASPISTYRLASSSPTATNSPTSLNGGGGAGTATTSSGVAKVKASQLKSKSRGRRGSGFKPDDPAGEGGGAGSGAAGTNGAGGGDSAPVTKLPMSAYINPNMTPQQQAALQAMLERNPGLAKYAPPGAFSPLPGATPATQTTGGRGPPTSHRMGDMAPTPSIRMGGAAMPPSMKLGEPISRGADLTAGGQGQRGADLLVGWGQDLGEEEESDEDVYKPPVSKKMGQSAPPPTTRPGGAVSPRDAIGGQPLKPPELHESTQESLKNPTKPGADKEDDEEGGITYRPTVDAMARGGEAERIMRKQNEMYDLQMPAHRTYVGGFAAAAYETAREYHYIQKAEKAAEDNMVNKARIRDKRPPPSI